MSARTSYTATELAALKLEGMPGTRQAIDAMAAREDWKFVETNGRGGCNGVRREYVIASLPVAVRQKLAQQMGAQAVKGATGTMTANALAPHTVASAASVTALKDWQRDCAEARLAIVQEIDRLANIAGVTHACRTICDLAVSADGDWPLNAVVARANARNGTDGDRTLSGRTLMRWRAAWQSRGFIGLAPGGKMEDLKAKAWHEPLLREFQKPQKPSLQYVMGLLFNALPQGVAAPSYHQARRFLGKMSVLELNKGRMGVSAMRAIKPFVRRDASKNLPGDFYVFDGHTFDAEIAHPRHGRPFRPEITWGIDGHTRLCVGFSVDLAESSMAVIDAVRYSCEKWAVPAILYTDRGSGYKNKRLGDPDLGILARIGITQKFGKARNPQAHGIVERAHQTIWVAGAKEFDTFVNAKMDSDAKQKVFRLTRNDVKVSGTSAMLMPFRLFIEWAQKRIDWYNNQPHRSLPRVVDANGVKRHMTPLEAWKRGVEMGAQLHTLQGVELDDTFRLYTYCPAPRGEITLYGNRYFHADLAHFNRKVKFRVGYDIHDPSQVWVRDPNGRLICIATLDGNKRDYFPMSVVDQARVKRAASRKARLHLHLQEVEDELNPPALLEHQQAEVLELNIERINNALAEPVLIEEMPPEEVIAAGRPIFKADYLKYEWLMDNPNRVNGADEEWIAAFRTTDDWDSLYREDEEASKAQEKAAVAGSNGGSYDATNGEAVNLTTSQPEKEE